MDEQQKIKELLATMDAGPLKVGYLGKTVCNITNRKLSNMIRDKIITIEGDQLKVREI